MSLSPLRSQLGAGTRSRLNVKTGKIFPNDKTFLAGLFDDILYPDTPTGIEVFTPGIGVDFAVSIHPSRNLLFGTPFDIHSLLQVAISYPISYGPPLHVTMYIEGRPDNNISDLYIVAPTLYTFIVAGTYVLPTRSDILGYFNSVGLAPIIATVPNDYIVAMPKHLYTINLDSMISLFTDGSTLQFGLRVDPINSAGWSLNSQVSFVSPRFVFSWHP